jgi:hypothetical protein
MQGWLTPAGLEWNTDPATNKDKPFLGEQYGGQVVWCMTGTTTCTAGSGPAATYAYWLSLQTRGICGRTGGELPPTFYKISETADTEVWNFTTEHCSEPWRGQIPNGPDGLGPRSITKQTQTNTQRVPMTWEEAEPHLSGTGVGSGKDFSAVDWKAITEGLLQRGASLPEPLDQTVSGPASQPGQKTTTTNSATGHTTTTTTTNNYQYAGNTVTVNTTASTVVTNNAGDVISNVTESTENKPEAEQADMCKTNPDSLACAKPDLDTPDGEIPRADETISYEPEELFGAGACPADLTMTAQLLAGRQLTVWNWQATCAYALPIRAVVIALATFAAFLIVMPGETRV